MSRRVTDVLPKLPTSTFVVDVSSGIEASISFHNLATHFSTFMTFEDLREAYDAIGAALQSLEVPM